MYTMKDIVPSSDTSLVDVRRKDLRSLSDEFELEKCVNWLQELNAIRVCLQFPKTQLAVAPRIVEVLQSKLGRKPFILADTAYGSCCVDQVAAQHVNADAIIHFGHSCLSPVDSVPVLYIFDKKTIDVEDFISCFKNSIKCSESVLLFYDVAYSHVIEHIQATLQDTYNRLIVTNLFSDSKLPSTHLLFGRCFSVPDNVNIGDYHVVFIGEDGPTIANIKYFMPNVPFFVYNPAAPGALNSYDINVSLFLRRRMFFIESIKNMKSLGILIGTLCVKTYLKTVERIKFLAKTRGIRCYIISVGKVSVTKLANFPEIDGYVLISCPENTLLDSKEYLQPIVTPYEVELALGQAQNWSEKFITDFTVLKNCFDNIELESAQETETNVSLISGRSRKAVEPEVPSKESTDMVKKEDGTLAVADSFGSSALLSRTWTGLQPQLGETEVKAAVRGRKGIPYKYENEDV